MELIRKNKADFMLALLFIGSTALSVSTSSVSLFWGLFIFMAIATFFYCLFAFRTRARDVISSIKRYDIFLISLMTIVFNANMIIFTNRIFTLVISALYYIGLRYLTKILSSKTKNQVQKNALNFSVLLSIFLGSNILVNLYVVMGQRSDNIVFLALVLVVFAMIYMLSHYVFMQNEVALKWTRVYSFVLSLVLTEVLIVSSFYIERYPSIYKGGEGLSITTTALFLTVVYYGIYGLMIQKINKKFHPKFILEYTSISAIIILTLFLTIKWFTA